jgi:hypothetical protein
MAFDGMMSSEWSPRNLPHGSHHTTFYLEKMNITKELLSGWSVELNGQFQATL